MNNGNENIKFKDWYNTLTMKEGTLINTATAARLLNVKMPYLYQLASEKKVRKYTYHIENKEITYYNYNDVMKLSQEKEDAKEVESLSIEIAKSSGVSKTKIIKEILKSTYSELIKFKERQLTNKKLYKEKITELKKEKGKLTAKDAVEAIKYTWQKGTEQLETELEDKISEGMTKLQNEKVKNRTYSTEKNTVKIS